MDGRKGRNIIDELSSWREKCGPKRARRRTRTPGPGKARDLGVDLPVRQSAAKEDQDDGSFAQFQQRFLACVPCVHSNQFKQPSVGLCNCRVAADAASNLLALFARVCAAHATPFWYLSLQYSALSGRRLVRLNIVRNMHNWPKLFHTT